MLPSQWIHACSAHKSKFTVTAAPMDSEGPSADLQQANGGHGFEASESQTASVMTDQPSPIPASTRASSASELAEPPSVTTANDLQVRPRSLQSAPSAALLLTFNRQYNLQKVKHPSNQSHQSICLHLSKAHCINHWQAADPCGGEPRQLCPSDGGSGHLLAAEWQPPQAPEQLGPEGLRGGPGQGASPLLTSSSHGCWYMPSLRAPPDMQAT